VNSISDNIAIFNEGVIQQVGAPIDLYNHPKNLFVANFLGTINVIKGKISNGTFSDGHDFKLENLKADNSDNCSLLVRPQNIYFEKKNDSDQNFKGKIQSKEFLGNIIRYQVLISGQVTTIDSMHEGKEKIYSKNEDVDVFVNPETSQVI